MLKRLLLAVALPVLAAAPVHGQTTTFFASGGDVTFRPTVINTTPFQIFADYLGISHRLIASSDGTLFTLDTKGSVAITSAGTLGTLTIANLPVGSSLVFFYAVNGQTYSGVDFYLRKTGGYNVQYADINNNNSGNFGFELRGIASATGLQCPGAQVGPPAITCSDIDPNAPPVTGTPEPGTIALFATGLAGLIPVAIRRRRASQS